MKKITDYKFNTIASPDAKLLFGFLDEFHFDKRSRSGSWRDRTLIKKNNFNKRAIVASVLKRAERTIFLSDNLIE